MPSASRAIRPPFRPVRALEAGALVALVAPAGPVAPARLAASADRVRALGFEPRIYPGARARNGYLAGPDRVRLDDIQSAFDDPAVDAVWALRGGYGTLRILDGLDLRRQTKDPIPFVGFSDNTAIHAAHAALGVVSFHGPHPGGDFPPETEEAFRRVLQGEGPAGLLPVRRDDPPPRSLVPGTVEAPLVGGNLALLASLCGTPQAVRAGGCILVLEDVGEPVYRIDRMWNQLERSGLTHGLAGLALGRFTEPPQRDPHDPEPFFSDLAARLGVPAVIDLPVGHVAHNWTVPLGARARLDGAAATLSLVEPAVRRTRR